MNKRSVAELQKLADHYGVDLQMFKGEKNDVRGVTAPPNHIFINNSLKEARHVFFHELGHVFCFKNGVYPEYHSVPKTRQDAKLFKQTAYEAECYVDLWARDEMLKWYPDLEYEFGYYGVPESKELLMDYIEEQLKDLLIK